MEKIIQNNIDQHQSKAKGYKCSYSVKQYYCVVFLSSIFYSLYWEPFLFMPCLLLSIKEQTNNWSNKINLTKVKDIKTRGCNLRQVLYKFFVFFSSLGSVKGGKWDRSVQNADCRLETANRQQNAVQVQNADCILGKKCRLRTLTVRGNMLSE